MATTDWQKLRTDIIAGIDVRAEYEAMGVKFKPNAEPNGNGWIACHAIGREDRNPSAAVNIKTGNYKDQGSGDSLGIYEFMVKRGHAKDWRDAQAQLAKKAGLSKRLPKKDQSRPQDKIEEVTWNPLAVRGLVARFPGVTIESLSLAGAKLCKYPAGSSQPQYVVALGAYGPTMLDDPPRGFVLQAASGAELEIYQGEGKAPDRRKRTNIGPSGMVGRHALKLIQERKPEEIEIIWKVEGISDLLSLQAAIPAELRDRHLVVTNAAGATETTLPGEVSSVVFLGQRVVILHDCDEPGQTGAKVWMGAAAKFCRSCVNLVLPFEITPNHGKDLRDWLTAGGTYADLLAMAEASEKARAELADVQERQASEQSSGQAGQSPGASGANGAANGAGGPPHPPVAGGDETLTVHQAILKRLGTIVLGHVSGGSRIYAFAEKSGKTFEIADIGRYKFENLLFDLGEHVESIVNTSPEPDPTKISFTQARKAFAIEGGKRVLSDAGYLGAGVWEVNGRLMLVNAGSAAIWNCKFSETRIPSCDGKLLDFGMPQPWFNFAELAELLKASESREWCDAVLNESIELFERWDNWRHKDTPQLVTALICCTWLQTIWKWRPQVAVAGPTSSGKSIFLETTLQNLFGPMAMFCAKATAAGIRQQVRNTGKIIIIDEFEHDNHRQEILELFRTSSRGAEIIRGTSDQKGAKFGLRHMPWVGAIETGMRKAADRNRYVMLELEKIKSGRGSTLRVPTPGELRELGQKLLVLGMRHWKTAIRFAEALQATPVEGVDHRAIETYAVPAAMLGAIMGMDQANATGLMVGMLKSRDFSQQQESDEEQLLKAIFESIVCLKGGERASVSELLQGTYSQHNEQPQKVLQRVGVRRVTPAKGGENQPDCVFFAPQAICRELLKGTEFFGQNIEEILGRVSGASRSRQKMGGHVTRGVLIPESSIVGLMGTGPQELDAEGQKHEETSIDYRDF